MVKFEGTEQMIVILRQNKKDGKIKGVWEEKDTFTLGSSLPFLLPESQEILSQ